MSFSLGIAGGGVIGRLIALKAAARGWQVTLFDRGAPDGLASCSAVATGMLSPWFELDSAERVIADLGLLSLKSWPEILRDFDMPVYFRKEGTLVVAHPQDGSELQRFRRNMDARGGTDAARTLVGSEVATLEPQIDKRFMTGIFLPDEGQIDTRGFLAASVGALRKAGVECRFNCAVESVKPHEIASKSEHFRFDVALDCRGYGAANDLKDLRPVRGETIHVHAPEIKITRPVRLMHPRWPLYVAPLPQDRYVIGATMVESEDQSPISVRSALELLSAAFALNAGFGEARIVETVIGLRPAFPDNLPRIRHCDGLLQVNGLYRHGYLMAPALATLACQFLESGKAYADFASLFEEMREKVAA